MLDHLLHFGLCLEQGEPVLDVSFVNADSLGQAANAVAALVDQGTEGMGFLGWPELVALDVFGETNLDQVAVGMAGHIARDAGEARLLGSPQAALSKD